jgi:hypothetical protein
VRGAASQVHVNLLRGRVQVHYAAGNGWFRVAGYGASIKYARRRRLLFSDRNLIGAVRVGPFILRALAPARPVIKGGLAQRDIYAGEVFELPLDELVLLVPRGGHRG